MRHRVAGLARRHWPAGLVTVVMTALTVNAWRAAGTFVLVLLAAATLGLFAVVGAVWWTSGAVVVRHSRQTEQAIEAAHGPKEVAR